jgi:hypothetical protein
VVRQEAEKVTTVTEETQDGDGRQSLVTAGRLIYSSALSDSARLMRISIFEKSLILRDRSQNESVLLIADPCTRDVPDKKVQRWSPGGSTTSKVTSSPARTAQEAR